MCDKIHIAIREFIFEDDTYKYLCTERIGIYLTMPEAIARCEQFNDGATLLYIDELAIGDYEPGFCRHGSWEYCDSASYIIHKPDMTEMNELEKGGSCICKGFYYEVKSKVDDD